MRLPLSAAREQTWLVHELAHDFVLDEVWEFPIVADASRGETFRTFCQLEDAARNEPLPGPARWLVQLRSLLGRLGLDRQLHQLPIPGCTETSVWERLKPEDRQAVQPPAGPLPFRLVYDRESERLLEFSNGSLHGLLHLSWSPKGGSLHAPRLAVYVKTRNRLGRAYMGLIYPFRILVVYPAVLRAAQRRWQLHRSQMGLSAQGREQREQQPSAAPAR
jgi:hypothetical protein